MEKIYFIDEETQSYVESGSFCLEPSLIKHKDGSIELIEISLVPIK